MRGVLSWHLARSDPEVPPWGRLRLGARMGGGRWPPVCPQGLVPQLLEVAARADAELLRALWAGSFKCAVLVMVAC